MVPSVTRAPAGRRPSFQGRAGRHTAKDTLVRRSRRRRVRRRSVSRGAGRAGCAEQGVPDDGVSCAADRMLRGCATAHPPNRGTGVTADTRLFATVRCRGCRFSRLITSAPGRTARPCDGTSSPVSRRASIGARLGSCRRHSRPYDRESRRYSQFRDTASTAQLTSRILACPAVSALCPGSGIMH